MKLLFRIYNRAFRIISLSLFLFITSCKKFVDIPPPPNQAQTSEIFKSDQSAISAMTGLYSQMRQASLALANGGITLTAGLSSDELYITASNANYDAFFANSLLPTSSVITSQLWQPAYRNIYQANAVVEGLATSTGLTDSVKIQLKGEALVIRALNYFYLVNLFGAVPLVTTTKYLDNALMPRTDIDRVYGQIISDLSIAKEILKASYPSSNRARPNKFTAAALLARVYLFRKDWTHAESEALSVIGSGLYSLSSLNVVFNSINSAETIWQLASDVSNTAEGITFIPSSLIVKPTYALTTYLINSFESSDQRLPSWTGKNTIGGTDYFYPNKYKQRVTIPVTEFYIVCRLAEQYLIRAEARAQLNNLTGALQDLNLIRARASLPVLSSSLNQAQVLLAVQQERRSELFAEWGHRWLDLKRTDLAGAVLSGIKAPNWQVTDVLYPLPLDEINRNPSLIQNPGY